MDIQPADILIHIINIVVLYLLLRVILYNPVKKFLDGRSERIAGELAEAKKAQSDADALRKQYDDKLAQASDKADELAAESAKNAAKKANAVLADAQEQASAIISQAHRAAEDEEKRAVKESGEKVTEMAAELAGKILKREVSVEDNRAIAEDYLRKLG